MTARRLLAMGVAASGKTVLAEAVAARLGLPFVEGDDLHPAANVAKMRAGHPLDDADRAPWLDAIAATLAGWKDAGQGGIVSCSALKRAYRDRLRQADPNLLILFIDVPRAVLVERIGHREGHFMPAVLLDSQLATLEPPAADEATLYLDGTQPVAMLVDRVVAALA